jgi:hypothetical protein
MFGKTESGMIFDGCTWLTETTRNDTYRYQGSEMANNTRPRESAAAGYEKL